MPNERPRRKLQVDALPERPHLLYMLLDKSSSDLKADYDIYANERFNSNFTHFKSKVVGCFCAECQKQIPVPDFEIDTTGVGRNLYVDGDETCVVTPEEHVPAVALSDVQCPDCGAHGRIQFLAMDNKHEAWTTPRYLYGHKLSTVHNDDENPDRVTAILDEAEFHRMRIPADTLKPERSSTVFCETLDLDKREMKTDLFYGDKSYAPSAAHNDRKFIADSLKWYYAPNSFNPESMYGMHMDEQLFDTTFTVGRSPLAHAIIASSLNHDLVCNVAKNTNELGEYFYRSHQTTDGGHMVIEEKSLFGCSHGLHGLNDEQKKVNYEKLKLMGQCMPVSDPLYRDMVATKLLMGHPTAGIHDDPEKASPMKMVLLADLIVRYPMAIQYAEMRANSAIQNAMYSDLRRRQQTDPNAQLEPAVDSKRAMLFREEVNHVMTQMMYADDKILEAIRKSKSVEQMLGELYKFVDPSKGTPEVTQSPTAVTKKVQVTKYMKQQFQKEPIATASNMYTISKMDIKDTSSVTRLLNTAEECMNTRVIRGKQPRSYSFCKAGIIAPIRYKSANQFMRLFCRSHNNNPEAMLNSMFYDTQYDDRMKGFHLLTECISLYAGVTRDAKIATGTVLTDDYAHNHSKQQLRGFLEHNPIEKAYEQFAEKYGEKTPEVINQLAFEILHDKENEAIVDYAEKHGLPAAQEKYSHRFTDELPPHKVLEQMRSEINASKTLYVTCRDDKDLFQNRTLREIHDELSIMSKKTIGANVPITYSDKFLKLEAEYPVPGEPEDSGKTWGFRLMHESHDFVRTASELHNCVAGGSYLESVQHGRSAILYMTDETNRKVACIELRPSGNNSWTVYQFQSDHDAALPQEYAGVAIQWMDEHNIDYSHCSDVQKFGTEEFFHGYNADYHTQEVDEVNGVAMDTRTMKTLTQQRFDAAVKVYGLNADGTLNLPQVPAELKAFA